MSQYLGFHPSENPFYYFASYNSEDKDLISGITTTMMHSGIHLWYDYGIEYGEGWEEKITTMIPLLSEMTGYFIGETKAMRMSSGYGKTGS